jgi:hypothetical protein
MPRWRWNTNWAAGLRSCPCLELFAFCIGHELMIGNDKVIMNQILHAQARGEARGGPRLIMQSPLPNNSCLTAMASNNDMGVFNLDCDSGLYSIFKNM